MGDAGALSVETCQGCRREAIRWRRIRDGFRRAMLNVASHELRTPLTPIVIYMRRLRELVDAPEALMVLDHIDRNMARLDQVIADFTDMARIDAGRLRVQTTDVDLGRIIDRAIDSIRPVIDARQLRVDVVRPGPVVIEADEERLLQVIENLLTNAVKACTPGGRIIMTALQDGKTMALKISDTGCGFDPALADGLFEPFGLNPKQPDAWLPSSGLGLTLCKHIVQAHGGTIEAFSRGEGLGATFTVHLPLRTSHVDGHGHGIAAT